MTLTTSAILPKVLDSTKPKRILELLQGKGHFPKKSQINSFLQHLRKKKFGATKLSLCELESWCANNCAVPDNDDDPFVHAYDVNFGDTVANGTRSRKANRHCTFN